MHETVICNGRDAAPQPWRLSARMDRLFKKLFILIPIGIIGNVLFSFAATDSAMLRSVAHFLPGYLIAAMILSVVPWFTGSFRLFLWGRFLGRNMRYQDAFKIALGAELGAAVSPPMIGGSAVKIGMLMQQGFTGGAALSLTVLESLQDSIFFIVMVPIALTASSSWDLPILRSAGEELSHPSLWMWLGSILVVLGIVMALLKQRSAKLFRRFSALRTLMDAIRSSYGNFTATYHTIVLNGKRIFALTMILISIQWVCRYSIVSLLLMSLGIPGQPVLFMALQVIVFALMTFIPTPGATGGAEVLFSLLYRALLPPGAIGLVTAGWRFLTFYFLLLLAAVLLLLFGTRSGAVTRRET